VRREPPRPDRHGADHLLEQHLAEPAVRSGPRPGQEPTAVTTFAHQLDPELLGYPSEYQNPAIGDVLPVAPFQYVESHDHSRFIAAFGTTPFSDVQWEPYATATGGPKTQPYAIALYTAKDVPILWHGQEFAENWTMPEGTDPRRTLSSPPTAAAPATGLDLGNRPR
jgi:hypothetical protein